MAVQKKKFLYALLLAVVFLAAGVFFGCGAAKKETEVSFSGQGEVSSVTLENGNKSYTATASKYNDFLGWYDGESLYSDQPTIIVDGKSPEKLKAVFGTNAEISTERFLNAAKNTLKDEEKNYLNFSANFDIEKIIKNTEKYNLYVAGSVAKQGEENNFNLLLKNEENKEKISLKIKNNASKTQIYLKLNDKEYNYNLPIEFINLNLSKEFTTLEEFVGAENYQTIHDILGYKNQLSFVESVENFAQESKVTLRVDKLLEFVKNIVLPNVAENDVWLKEFIETFTKKYQGIGKTMPQMRVVLDIKYQGQQEEISDVSGQIILAEDYKLELEETYIIPQSSLSFDMTGFNISYSDSPLTEVEIDEELKTIEMANISLQGQVDFVFKDVLDEETVLSPYILSLNSDVNPFAFKEALSGEEIDWNKIDWKNFGYLNLRLSLNEQNQTQEQLNAHNGTTDYLNILIDSDKFGENMLVYLGLYNPKMSMVGTSITDNYVFNSAVYLPKLMDVYGSALASSFPSAEDVNLGLIVDALKGTISFVLNNDGANINDIMYKFLDGIMKSSDENVQIVKENFYFENGKIYLRLENESGSDIKEIVSQAMSQFSSWLNYSNFTSNLFGSATHISFNFTKLGYGEVSQQTKSDDLAFYNSKHKTIVGVESVEGLGLTKEYKETLPSLIGKTYNASGVFSDGENYQTFEDYLADDAPLKLTLWDYEILSENEEKAVINIYFTYSQGNFADILYDKNIPYGLIVYQQEITL